MASVTRSLSQAVVPYVSPYSKGQPKEHQLSPISVLAGDVFARKLEKKQEMERTEGGCCFDQGKTGTAWKKTKEVGRGTFVKGVDGVNLDDGLNVLYSTNALLQSVSVAFGSLGPASDIFNWTSIVAILGIAFLSLVNIGIEAKKSCDKIDRDEIESVKNGNAAKTPHEKMMLKLKAVLLNPVFWLSILIAVGVGAIGILMAIAKTAAQLTGLATALSCIGGGIITIISGIRLINNGETELGRAKILNGILYIAAGGLLIAEAFGGFGSGWLVDALVFLIPLVCTIPVAINLYTDTGRKLNTIWKKEDIGSRWKLEELLVHVQRNDKEAVKKHLDEFILPYADIQEIESKNGTKNAIAALRVLQAISSDETMGQGSEADNAVKALQASIKRWKVVQHIRLLQIFAGVGATGLGLYGTFGSNFGTLSEDQFMVLKNGFFFTSTVVPAYMDFAHPLYRNSPVVVDRSAKEEDTLKEAVEAYVVSTNPDYVGVSMVKPRDFLFGTCWDKAKFWKKFGKSRNVKVEEKRTTVLMKKGPELIALLANEKAKARIVLGCVLDLTQRGDSRFVDITDETSDLVTLSPSTEGAVPSIPTEGGDEETHLASTSAGETEQDYVPVAGNSSEPSSPTSTESFTPPSSPEASAYERMHLLEKPTADAVAV